MFHTLASPSRLHPFQAMMVDIKSENVRLQRFAEILESSPDLTIVINREGKITYIR